MGFYNTKIQWGWEKRKDCEVMGRGGKILKSWGGVERKECDVMGLGGKKGPWSGNKAER